MINVRSHNVMFIAYFQHTNTSAIAIATKLAAMSPRCYSLAEKIMDMYEGGELEKKKKRTHHYHHPWILFQFSLQCGPTEE